MGNWQVEFTRRARRDLLNLDPATAKIIYKKIEWLGNNFDQTAPQLLTADYREFFKLRIGDYRIFYRVFYSTKVLEVEYIDRRDRVYKKKRR